MGNSELSKQLNELGLETYSPALEFVTFKFTIPHGRFKDKEIEIALNAPKFPIIPPSGIFIKPFILPISGGGGAHPNGGIHDSKQPTVEFQYWSRPFREWENSEKSAKEYLAFIRTLFDFE